MPKKTKRKPEKKVRFFVYQMPHEEGYSIGDFKLGLDSIFDFPIHPKLAHKICKLLNDWWAEHKSEPRL